MSIYTKDEIKNRKLVRKCQIICAILAIINAIFALTTPSSTNIQILIISFLCVGIGQLYLDKTTIWDLKDKL